MYLTREEERIYEGERGTTLQKAMEILVALGDIYGADKLIPIKSAQIAGVSYKTIGDAGLDWISELEGKVVVPSTLNPAGMDLVRWKEMGISEEFALKQKRIIRTYSQLGIARDCTCTPYYLENSPRYRDNLAWSESSAVSYANSVLGARTNREGGPSALAAALIGSTPRYGYHLDENREPKVLIQVEGELKDSDYGALGVIVGGMIGDMVPLFRLETKPFLDELKALGAAMAASGAVALYHIENITPEARRYKEPEERITIEYHQIRGFYEDNSDVDIVALGCPHCSTRELIELASLLKDKKVKRELWICTSRAVKTRCRHLVKKIEASGARVFCDTCMVVSPACEGFKAMMVNSGKAHIYIPNLCKLRSVLANTQECIRTVLT